MNEREQLIQRMMESRQRLRALVAQVDPRKQIYPGWTMREFLAHMTGWDDSVIIALRAHVEGVKPDMPAWMGVDAYNAETLNTRETVDLDKVRAEWEQTRTMLIDLLRHMPEEKFNQPLMVPWGRIAPVKDYVDVFIHHEAEEHARDLEEWLKNPDQPLLDRH